ncbi:MAG: hypothetical protein L6V93_04865 [Clostridiales bacterium]|nr:MAG: hypothetical protein L6V93_04865 [Clostridiales bacterium]
MRRSAEKVGDVNSYLDYGYFGVLGAEFDEKRQVDRRVHTEKVVLHIAKISRRFFCR